MKVISEISIMQYKILELDETVPITKYTKYIIDGVSYPTVPIYDIENIEHYIAVESSDSFVGKTVMFGE